MTAIGQRMQELRTRSGLERLPAQLEGRYGIRVSQMEELDAGVLRIDRSDGPSWVARVFPASRPFERAAGDVAFLRFLEECGFPAERCAHPEPLSALDGQVVVLTEYLDGPRPSATRASLYALGDLIGRLHALPGRAGATDRPAGSLHHLGYEGTPAEDLRLARAFLDDLEERAPAQHSRAHAVLRDLLAVADDCAGLPEAYVHPDPVMRNAIALGGHLVLVDWTGAGRGPRIASLAPLLFTGALKRGGWDPARVEAIAAGYRAHVHLEPEELARLSGAMLIRQIWHACWQCWVAVDNGETPTGSEWWMPDRALTDAITAAAQAAFAR